MQPPTAVFLAAILAGCCLARAAYYSHPGQVPGAVVNDQGTYELSVREDGKDVTWYIFQDEASQTAFFFVPGTERSQWDDPRSEEEIAAAGPAPGPFPDEEESEGREAQGEFQSEQASEEDEDEEDEYADPDEEDVADSDDDTAWDFAGVTFPDLALLEGDVLAAVVAGGVAVVVLVALLVSFLRKGGSTKAGPSVKKVTAATAGGASKADDAAVGTTPARVTRSAVRQRA